MPHRFSELGAEDLPRLLPLLADGFAERPSAFWAEGLARLRAHRPLQVPEVPLAVGLEVGGELVGVALTPSSLRPRADSAPEVLVNVSSWTIRAPHRWLAYGMLRWLSGRAPGVLTDLSPTPGVQAMLHRLRWKPVNVSTMLCMLAGPASRPGPAVQAEPWRPGQPLPPGSPPADLVESQLALGCQAMLLHHPDGSDLLVWRRGRWRGMPMADWVLVPSHRRLLRSLPVVARLLMRQGQWVMQLDARRDLPAGWHTVYRPRGVWFARGGDFEDRTDFLASERCLLGV